MASKPQVRKTFGQKMAEKDAIDVDFYGLIRQKISTPLQVTTPFGGEQSATTTEGAASGFLRTIGDSMIGPIAYYPIPKTVAHRS
jgi:hypothetical protein